MNLVDAVRADATASLLACCRPSGLIASGRRHGHHQVWARDSMIALLGGALTDNEPVLEALRASIALLKTRQARTGCIPNNVDAVSRRPNFRAYADGGLWWVIGSTILAPDPDTVRTVLAWYETQDVDQTGLLSMQEGSDWQDLFCTRGKGLYLNCLYVLALHAAARLTGDPAFGEQAALVKWRINDFHWYRGDGDMRRHIGHTFSTESREQQDSLGRKRFLPEKRILREEQYYLPYLGFRACGEWFDAFGHLLAVLAGVSDARQTAAIFEFFEKYDLHRLPMRALYPTVQPGDPDWRDYYGMLNLPDQYHNGGVWPFLGGFYVAALVKCGYVYQARAALERLAALNREGEFNEWHHGATGEPMGVRDQAWSAGMYVFAHECVQREAVPFLA